MIRFLRSLFRRPQPTYHRCLAVHMLAATRPQDIWS